ncbi:MAG TPA: hypothetical protein VMK42_06945 [Anaeromyxobacteraceae bacterium]|nr:hypothetical protein [Anaeromyxobacteraceae bacterium]
MSFLVAYDPRKRHAFGGPGHKLGVASFLCPVCAEPLFSDEGLSVAPCPHVSLVYDSAGEIRYTTPGVTDLVAEAEQHASATGEDAMEALRKQLGMNVVFFELLDRPAGAGGVESVTLVIDLDAAGAPIPERRQTH